MTLSCGFCQYPTLGGLKLLFTEWIKMLRAKGFAFQRQETKGALSPASSPPANCGGGGAQHHPHPYRHLVWMCVRGSPSSWAARNQRDPSHRLHVTLTSHS